MGLMTPAQKIILLGGSTPQWLRDLKAQAGATPALALAFDLDQAFLGKTKTPISSLLTCSRASTGYYTKADGTLTSFNSNVLRYGTNGLLVEEARTNVAQQSQTLTNAYWSVLASATIATSAVAGPDPSVTAFLLSIVNTSGARLATAAQISGLTNGSTYTDSVYVMAATGGDVGKKCTLYAYDGSFKATGFTLTASWQRVTNTFTISGTTAYLNIGTETGTNDICAMYIIGVQREAGSFATSYIPTTSASATRAADNVHFAVNAVLQALTGPAGALFSAYAQTGTVANTTNGRIFCISGTNNIFASNTTTKIFSFDGSTLTNATLGSGSNATACKMAFGVDGSNNGSIVANNGTVAATTFTNRTTAGGGVQQSIGSDDGTSLFIDGYVKRLAIWSGVRLGDSALAALTV